MSRRSIPQRWRNHDDAILLRGKRFPFPGDAPSLRPDHRTMDSYVSGDLVARAIIAAWRPSFCVVEVRA